MTKKTMDDALFATTTGLIDVAILATDNDALRSEALAAFERFTEIAEKRQSSTQAVYGPRFKIGSTAQEHERITKALRAIVAANADKVAQAKARPALVGWFVGQTMLELDGRASPQVVFEIAERMILATDDVPESVGRSVSSIVSRFVSSGISEVLEAQAEVKRLYDGVAITEPAAVGDVVQIDPGHDEMFGACLMTVTEVKSRGLQGYIRIPGRGDAEYRVPNGKYFRVGPAAVGRVREEAEGTAA